MSQENFDQVIPATIKEYVAKRTIDDVSAEVKLIDVIYDGTVKLCHLDARSAELFAFCLVLLLDDFFQRSYFQHIIWSIDYCNIDMSRYFALINDLRNDKNFGVQICQIRILIFVCFQYRVKWSSTITSMNCGRLMLKM